jgi:hypothetical protein
LEKPAWSESDQATHPESGNSLKPGTGSKSSSEGVDGYTKKNGTHVDAYRRSTPDHNFNNNWSTKGM